MARPVPTLVADLSERWRRARHAALIASLPQLAGEQSLPADLREEELLSLALTREAEGVLRRVFDYSKQLGDGFRAHYRADLPMADMALLLPALSSPCALSPWKRTEQPLHYRSERPVCAVGKRHPRACDYYREALSGLVLGLSTTVYHARHESLGRGGERCVDILYVHPQSPVRFGPLPDDIAEGLKQVRSTTRMFDSSARIEFLGISEGTLYYSLTSGRDVTNLNLTTVIEQAIRRRYPELTTRDVSPRTVLNES